MLRWSGDDSMSIWDQSRSNNQNLYIFWKMKKQRKKRKMRKKIWIQSPRRENEQHFGKCTYKTTDDEQMRKDILNNFWENKKSSTTQSSCTMTDENIIEKFSFFFFDVLQSMININEVKKKWWRNQVVGLSSNYWKKYYVWLSIKITRNSV